MIIIIIVIYFSIISSISAENIWLDAQVNCGFKPKSANFFITANEFELVSEAYLIQKTGQYSSDMDYYALTLIELDDIPNILSYSIFLEGDNKQACFYEVTKQNKEQLLERISWTENLRKKVLSERNQLQILRNNIRKSEDNLSRLRHEASQIGNLRSIAIAQEELKKLEERRRMLNNDIERLNEFLLKAKNQATPRNFVKRQAELTTQMEELAQIGKKAEENEHTRKVSTSDDTQKMQSLVEQVGSEDFEQLKQELKQLRIKRQKLENSQGQSNPSTINQAVEEENYLPQ
jgi:DNA repair exonuclease SbcCD ATPase subunit